MTIERPDRTSLRRSLPRSGSLAFDEREIALAVAVRQHVLLRDACLAPSTLMPDKLDALDHARRPEDSEVASVVERISIVARMARVRRTIRDTGALLDHDRRLLVLLDVLASLPDASGSAWSRNPVDLLAEAATGLGFRAADIRRLARRLEVARRALPTVESRSTATRALADSLGSVLGATPGAAVAQAALLLAGDTPPGWTPSPCGTALLDVVPTGGARFAGTLVARSDLGAFVADLATLRVAADISPALHLDVAAVLPDLARDLRTAPAGPTDAAVLTCAADLVDRTTGLLSRGFRRFDRTATPRWVTLDA